MEDRLRSLIAVGASAAANCRPCLEHHVGQARRHGAADDELTEAMDIGLQVNQGAARQTRAFVDGLLGQPVAAATGGSSCC